MEVKFSNPMHENTKLTEAHYFLAKIQNGTATRAEFEFELSAFLSSARSVMQYALDEAKLKKGGQKWFDDHTQIPEVKFLKKQRDTSIHVEPVKPQQGLAFGDSLSCSGGLVSITLTDIHGNVSHGIAKQTLEPEPEPKIEMLPESARVTYRFTDWPGTEIVVELCKHYLCQLEMIVAEGQANGFLS